MQRDNETASPSGLGIAQVFRQSARLYADRVAVQAEDGTKLTYRQLDALSDRVAAFMMRRGVMPGTRIAVLSDPCPEYVAVNIACAKVGVTAVGLNTRFTSSDVAYCVQDSGARVVFFDPVHGDVLSGIDDDCIVELSLRPSSPASALSLADAVDSVGEGSVPELGTPDDIHTIIYTSGTTGRPKGAMISQAAAAVRALRLVSWFGLSRDDAFLGWLPLFHTGGEEPLNATLLSGGRYLTFRRADPDLLVRSVDDGGGSWSFLLPGMFAEFLDAAAARRSQLAGFRFGGGYGNLLPTRLIDDLVDRGPVFYDLFGQTEASLLIASNRIDTPGETAWRKQPAPLLDVRIVGEDGTEQAIDEPGECVVRGPSVMSGYLNQPEATREVFAGGWLHTGDILKRNEDGTLKFADRKKYLIKTGGENVYPAEVESVLTSHPSVAEACVVGVADDRWGETVKAFVVLRPGHKQDPAALDAHCRVGLAGFKRPRLIEFIDTESVPRSATGKIIRNELAKRPVDEAQRVGVS
jgi:acyl-CoA synthetase (AMP-forming)/AMP-acid ligase II